MRTIAAISTPYGSGGIAVIRISGAAALDIAERVFRPASGKPIREMDGYTAAYGDIYDGEVLLDNGILTLFRSPHSYTGEDVAEISCHGGLFVTRQVLRACFDAGAHPAEAGEFTKRALLGGKLSLTQAESVIDIIEAHSRTYLACSQAQRDGALYQRIEEISEKILHITAQIAAWIDYPEEDLDSFEISSQLGQLTGCKLQLQLLLESHDIGKIMRDGILTAIVGKPNVGKSTIMNLLAGCDRSIVTNVAGTTRDIIEESVNLGDFILRLSDCAGLRETDELVEGIGVELMYKRLDEAELVLAVFDNSRPLEKEDYILLDRIKDKERICIINKSDLENKLDLTFLATQFGNVIEITAKERTSLEPLIAVVKKVLQLDRIDLSGGFIANERQRLCALAAEEALGEAIDGINSGVTLDATGVMLETALSHLYALSGRQVSAEVVDEVFRRFCVGK